MFQDIGDSLQVAFRDALSDFFGFIPNLIGAIILLVVGWLLGKLIGGLVTKALQAVGLNKMADKGERDGVFKNARVKKDAPPVVGADGRWAVGRGHSLTPLTPITRMAVFP